MSIPSPSPEAASPWPLWRRWVAANTVAELVGLGGSAVVAVGLASTTDRMGVPGVVLMALAMIAIGTFLEGVLVGLLQGGVLRRALPAMPVKAWVGATALGAGIAWTLGMLPSSVMQLVMDSGGAQPAASPPVISEALQVVMAASMGVVLGPFLAVPQWRVLRRYVARAGWWVPANSAAWAVGMVLVFQAAGSTPWPLTPAKLAVPVVLLCLAGAAVGAVHGAVLVWLLRQGPPGSTSTGSLAGHS
ncbi:hypothetical protein [Pyxidicoccus xibeiensis]|uniref:hypothetical protein n=1 Tax=Pyxidicoccus xibeiensis TaxID=2906759 RepID=UPI0020A74C07|nr:hypothetical protein [Pyxidicoccus xibeiensis]MCP3144851.1 hypothetical protein [Pyxidicoccus xibeiensis]